MILGHVHTGGGLTFDQIRIGDQIWSKQNISVTKLRNGKELLFAQTKEQWLDAAAKKQGAYCLYNTDNTIFNKYDIFLNIENSHFHKYGILYNWYAISNPNFAPIGWRVPNDSDWQKLLDFLGDDADMSLKSRSDLWETYDPGIGILFGPGSDESGFSGEPGGGRNFDAEFMHEGKIGSWWSCSSAEDSDTHAPMVGLGYDDNEVVQGLVPKINGLSCRLVRDFTDDERLQFVFLDLAKDGLKLKDLSDQLKANRKIVMTAVNQNGNALEFASDELKKDIEVVMTALRQSTYSFKYIDPSLAKNRGLVLSAITNGGPVIDERGYEYYFLELIDKQFLNDKEILLLTIKNKCYGYHMIPPKFRNDVNFNSELIKISSKDIFDRLDKSLYSNKKFVIKALRKNGNYLEKLDNKFKKDKEVVLAAVTSWGASLKFASASIRADFEIVNKAIEKKYAGFVIQYASADLRKNRELVIKAIKHGASLTHVDKSFSSDREIVLLAVKNDLLDGTNLKLSHQSFRDDKNIVLAAVKRSGLAIQYASERLRNDPAIAQAALSKSIEAYQYIGDSLKKSKKFAMLAASNAGAKDLAEKSSKQSVSLDGISKSDALSLVRKNGLSLQFLQKFNADKKVVLTALRQNTYAFKYVNESLLRNSREVVKASVSKNYTHEGKIGNAIEFIDSALINEKNIALKAVKEYWKSVNFLNEKMLNDTDVMLAAVKLNGEALKYASKKIQKNQKIVLAAVRQDGFSLQYADKSLQGNKNCVIAAVTQNAWVLQRVNDKFKKDRDVIFAALKQNVYTYDFIDESLKKDADILSLRRKLRKLEVPK